jgi:transcriptional regulator with XRE-family HTH domain
MEIRDVLAKNLRALRKARHMSQEALADEADIDRTYISSIERGVYATSVDVLDRLAKALGVEASELLSRDRKQNPGNATAQNSDQS